MRTFDLNVIEEDWEFLVFVYPSGCVYVEYKPGNICRTLSFPAEAPAAGLVVALFKFALKFREI